MKVWNGLRTEINNILTDECKVNEDKLLGPFFISKNILDEIKINKDKIDELEIIDEAYKNIASNKEVVFLAVNI